MTGTKPVAIYGIKACDTMKKARDWLDAAGVAYGFHDYKVRGIDAGTLRGWAKSVGVRRRTWAAKSPCSLTTTVCRDPNARNSAI